MWNFHRLCRKNKKTFNWNIYWCIYEEKPRQDHVFRDGSLYTIVFWDGSLYHYYCFLGRIYRLLLYQYMEMATLKIMFSGTDPCIDHVFWDGSLYGSCFLGRIPVWIMFSGTDPCIYHVFWDGSLYRSCFLRRIPVSIITIVSIHGNSDFKRENMKYLGYLINKI